MKEQTLSLGERILLATRLAVEEHLRQSACEELQSERQMAIGGAGRTIVTDDSLPLARGAREGLALRSAMFAFGAALPAEGEAA